MKKMYLAVACLLLTPLNANAGDGHAHGPDGSHISNAFQSAGGGKVISLSAEAEENLEIKTETITPRPIAPIHTLYGRITADPRRVEQITAPFSGKVEKIFVLPGSFVARNEELVRVIPLQVGSTPLVLKAKQGGYVTDLNVSPGHIFEPTENLLTVNDLEVVLFEGDLFDLSNANKIKTSHSCEVHTKRFPGKHFACQIETVDATLKGNPPVGHVHARLVNQDGELKPGMTGEIHLAFGAQQLKLTVPEVAVLGKFEKTFVYLKNNGAYERVFVRLGESYGDDMEVLEGLSPGDMVVTRGHYQLQYAQSDTEHTGHHHEASHHEDSHHEATHTHSHDDEHSHAEEHRSADEDTDQHSHDSHRHSHDEAHDHHDHEDHQH